MIVGSYTIIFLGSCSPVHCRSSTAVFGLACVIMSYLSGFGISFLLGGEVSELHSLMPYLLIGIGVDDMFVIANAVDQVPFSFSADQRVISAIKHAGPSITISSITNGIAFFLGSTQTSVVALASFCEFACVCVFMLYVSVLTLFIPVMTWDTRRIENKKGECCQLCCCKEDTALCLHGKCLSNKQKVHSGVEIIEKYVQKQVESDHEDLILTVNLDDQTNPSSS